MVFQILNQTSNIQYLLFSQFHLRNHITTLLLQVEATFPD